MRISSAKVNIKDTLCAFWLVPCTTLQAYVSLRRYTADNLHNQHYTDNYFKYNE